MLKINNSVFNFVCNEGLILQNMSPLWAIFSILFQFYPVFCFLGLKNSYSAFIIHTMPCSVFPCDENSSSAFLVIKIESSAFYARRKIAYILCFLWFHFLHSPQICNLCSTICSNKEMIANFCIIFGF